MLSIFQRALIGGNAENIVQALVAMIMLLNLNAFISDVYLGIVGALSKDIRTRCRYLLLENSVFSPLKNIAELRSMGNIARYKKHEPVAKTKRDRGAIVAWIVLVIVKLFIEGALVWSALEKTRIPIYEGSDMTFRVANNTRRDFGPQFHDCTVLRDSNFVPTPHRQYIGRYRMCAKTDALTIPANITQGRLSILTYTAGHLMLTGILAKGRADFMTLTLETDDTSGVPFVLDKNISQEEHFAVHNNHLTLLAIDSFRCRVEAARTSHYAGGGIGSTAVTVCTDIRHNIWMAKLRTAMIASFRIEEKRSPRFHRTFAFVGFSGETNLTRTFEPEQGPVSSGRHVLWQFTGFRLNVLGLTVVLGITIVLRTLITCFVKFDVGDELLVAVNQMYPGMCAVNKFRTWVSGGRIVASNWRTGPSTVHAGFCDPPTEVDLNAEDQVGITAEQNGKRSP